MEKTQQPLSGIQIISLVGYQGSGKSTIGKLLSLRLGTLHIEASDIAKEIAGTNVRSDLPIVTMKFTEENPDWMGQGIEKRIKDSKQDLVVLTGIRERHSHIYLAAHGADVVVCELDVPAELRFDRLKKLGKVSNAEEFLEQEIKEQNLGVPEVLKDAVVVVPNVGFTDQSKISNWLAFLAKEQLQR